MAAVVLLVVPVAASHHEDDAAEPKPANDRIIVIEPSDQTLLVGTKRRFDAAICNADGSGCKDARKAKWSVEPTKGLRFNPKKGSSTLVETRQPGSYEISARQAGVVGSTTLQVNEPPVREATGPSSDEYRVYISPDEVELAEGQTAVFTLWGCTLGPDGRLGPNDMPDGVDDACVELDILELNVDEGAPASIGGPVGSRFALTIEPFPEDVGTDRVFIGAQAVTEFGGIVPSIVARRGEQISEFVESDRLLGDADGDGDFDADDQLAVFDAFYFARYDPAFDVNEDGVLDRADWDALIGGRQPMPTPPGLSPTG